MSVQSHTNWPGVDGVGINILKSETQSEHPGAFQGESHLRIFKRSWRCFSEQGKDFRRFLGISVKPDRVKSNRQEKTFRSTTGWHSKYVSKLEQICWPSQAWLNMVSRVLRGSITQDHSRLLCTHASNTKLCTCSLCWTGKVVVDYKQNYDA